MILIVFALLGVVITLGILYAVYKLLKADAEIKRLERKRKKAAEATLIKVQNHLKNDNIDAATLDHLKALEETIRKELY